MEHEAPRSLHDFKRPQEVLRAVRDAISDHRHHYMATGKIHDGVTVDTIYIGAHKHAPYSNGFLIRGNLKSNSDSTFKSFRSLSHILGRKEDFPLDYLDDLESFYYVLVWMCYTYEGPGRALPVYLQPRTLTCWVAHPDSRAAILEKETMLFGTGISWSEAPVSEFWGGEAFQQLLDNMHYVIASRYKKKTDLGAHSVAQLKLHAEEDYQSILDVMNTALLQWDRQ